MFGKYKLGTSDVPEIMYAGDVNLDGVVNMSDVILIASAFGAVQGDTNYQQHLDINLDGAINMADVVKINTSFGLVKDHINASIHLDSDCQVQSYSMAEFKNVDLDLNGKQLIASCSFKVNSDNNTGSSLNINGGRLEISGDFDFGQPLFSDTLLMQKDASYIKVDGYFHFASSVNQVGNLSAGTIELKGELTINEGSADSSFYATDRHKILLTGTQSQTLILSPTSPLKNRKINILIAKPGTYTIQPASMDPIIWDPATAGYVTKIDPLVNVNKRGFNRGNGVFVPTGNYNYSSLDLESYSPGLKLVFSRLYNSKNITGNYGVGWTQNFIDSTIQKISGFQNPGDTYQVTLPDGSINNFIEVIEGSSKYYEPIDNRCSLDYDSTTGEYTVRTQEQISFHYKNLNNSIKLYNIIDELGNSILINNPTSTQQIIKDSLNKEYTINYNPNGSISSIFDSNRTISYSYNNGKLENVTDPEGNIISYEYTNGLLYKIKSGSQLLHEIHYFSSGVNSGKVEYTIDSLNKKQSYNYLAGMTIVTDWDNDSNKVIKSTTYYYDEYLNITKVEIKDDDGDLIPDTNTKMINYNEGGIKSEVSSVVDFDKNESIYRRNSLGQIKEVRNSDNSSKLTFHNMYSKPVIERDESNYFTFYKYDTNGKKLLMKAQTLKKLSQEDIDRIDLSNFIEQSGNVIDYIIDYVFANEVNILSITNYQYYNDGTYDDVHTCNIKGLVKQITDPEGVKTKFTYYSDGTLKEKIEFDEDLREIKTTYTYNNLKQIETITTPKGYKTKFEYDKNGRVIKEMQDYVSSSNSYNSTKRYVYDSLGRKTKEISPKNYNSARESTDGKYYDVNNIDISTYYSTDYYPSGEVMSVRSPDTLQYTKDDSTVVASEIVKTSYTYDKYGNIQTKVLPNKSVYKYEYDLLGRLTNTYFKEHDTDADSTYVLLSNNSYSVSVQSSGLNNSIVITTDYTPTNTFVKTTTYDFAGRGSPRCGISSA